MQKNKHKLHHYLYLQNIRLLLITIMTMLMTAHMCGPPGSASVKLDWARETYVICNNARNYMLGLHICHPWISRASNTSVLAD